MVEISDFLTNRALETEGRSVLEPSCGDGVFITSLLKNKKNKKINEISAIGYKEESEKVSHIITVHPDFKKICNVINGDFFKFFNEKLKHKKFDIILPDVAYFCAYAVIGSEHVRLYMQNLFTSYTGWIHHERFKTNSRTACQTWKKVRPWNRIDMQRIVYLDTNILGQPHTYFVSKLPGATDREKIQEAFGLSDETLQESLRFNVGQWLLISHSATGVDDLPIPVQIPDANVRINDFLNNFSKTEGSRQ